MANTSDAEPTGRDAGSTGPGDAVATDDSSSVADKLATAGRALWAAFLASIVGFVLIPPAAVALGTAPFDPAGPTPYVALAGAALVGTAALVAAETYGV